MMKLFVIIPLLFFDLAPFALGSTDIPDQATVTFAVS